MCCVTAWLLDIYFACQELRDLPRYLPSLKVWINMAAPRARSRFAEGLMCHMGATTPSPNVTTNEQSVCKGNGCKTIAKSHLFLLPTFTKDTLGHLFPSSHSVMSLDSVQVTQSDAVSSPMVTVNGRATCKERIPIFSILLQYSC